MKKAINGDGKVKMCKGKVEKMIEINKIKLLTDIESNTRNKLHTIYKTYPCLNFRHLSSGETGTLWKRVWCEVFANTTASQHYQLQEARRQFGSTSLSSWCWFKV